MVYFIIIVKLIYMNLQSKPDSRPTVKVCKGDLCIETKGQEAKAITAAFTFMLLMIGLAAIAKAS